MSDLVHRTIETRLGALEYAEFGEGPAVLSLHGAMGGFDQGLILARTLGDEEHRYIAPSRPGYLGTRLRFGRTPQKQADLHAALLDALEIDRVVVMAVSGGGPSALWFALRHPQRCAGMILASCPAGPLKLRPPLSFKMMLALSRFRFVSSAMEQRALKDPEGMAARSIPDPALLERTMRDEEAWGLMKELMLSTMTRLHERAAGTLNDANIGATVVFPLERIAVPLLALQGTEDPLVPIEANGREFVRRVEGAKLIELTGGGHAAIFSHRAEARTQAAAFLAENSGY